MEENGNKGRRIQKLVTVSDSALIEKIEKIMTLPGYENKFGKVINGALYYGLDGFYNTLFPDEQVCTEEDGPENFLKDNAEKEDGENDIAKDFYFRVVALLKEIIVNENINKSMLCSLFNLGAAKLTERNISGSKFAEGAYDETPGYLCGYEEEGLKEAGR